MNVEMIEDTVDAQTTIQTTSIALVQGAMVEFVFTAARAVSLEYGLTIGDAIHRLAAVESWTQIEGATA